MKATSSLDIASFSNFSGQMGMIVDKANHNIDDSIVRTRIAVQEMCTSSINTATEIANRGRIVDDMVAEAKSVSMTSEELHKDAQEAESRSWWKLAKIKIIAFIIIGLILLLVFGGVIGVVLSLTHK